MKANQVRVPLSSIDCRRGHIDLRRARRGLKAEDPLPDGGIITDSPEQLSISEKKIVVSASDISDNSSNFDDIFEEKSSAPLTKEISPLNENQPDKEKAITPDPIIRIDHSSTQVQKTELSTTSLSQNIIDDTDEALDFAEMKHKEHVSKAIMERIREKKLRDQNSSLGSTSSKPSYENQNLESSIISQSISNISELSSDNNLPCDSESKSPTNVSSNQRREALCFVKIPYNQKVEQGLRIELSSCTKDNNHKISKVSDVQIPEFSLEAILSGSNSKLIDTNCQAQSAISSEIKAIGMTNCHAHMSTSRNSLDSSKEIGSKNLSTSSRQPIPRPIQI
ncbi:3437_t:CDS:2 [Acaulospora morrowiae]|uniref:3437_t:CDS:1 n=1 Tax=Acaulospora morrowiae TaxID=94023 RepID=A0A9N9BR47_9GLOM|nr:3437_t:CDS:2 [Acaulospora morrowiae]